jgi:hypothetical protein
LFFFVFLASGCVRAQSRAAASAAQGADGVPTAVSTPSNPNASYPLTAIGTWDLSVWAKQEFANSANGDIGDAYVSMAGFRAGYVFGGPAGRGASRGTMEYFFDVIPVFVLTKPQVTYGGGISPIGLKWNFTNGRRHPYLDVSLGGILSTRNVPPGNTSNLNFTVSAGGGAAIFSRERKALTANVGFWHLSNAHIGRENPSLNALEIGIEYHWFKPR